VLEGGSFVFELTVTDPNTPSDATGGQAVAEMEVAVNSPPDGGDFTVEPAEGNEFETFTMTADGYEDSHQPLQYRFAYLNKNGMEVDTAEWSGTDFVSYAWLPAGEVTLVAYIKDAEDGETRATTTVVLNEAEEVEAAVFLDSMEEAVENQDLDSMLGAMMPFADNMDTSGAEEGGGGGGEGEGGGGRIRR
jgi:hypothetical protein